MILGAKTFRKVARLASRKRLKESCSRRYEMHTHWACSIKAQSAGPSRSIRSAKISWR